jgi:hypothetical protein
VVREFRLFRSREEGEEGPTTDGVGERHVGVAEAVFVGLVFKTSISVWGGVSVRNAMRGVRTHASRNGVVHLIQVPPSKSVPDWNILCI